jgi:hypothetical protein
MQLQISDDDTSTETRQVEREALKSVLVNS